MKYFIIAIIASTILFNAAPILAQGGGNGESVDRGRVGISVDRKGLHLRLTIGNPQSLDHVITGGRFQEQVTSPINQQGFHGTDAHVHGGIGDGDAAGGPGFGSAR